MIGVIPLVTTLYGLLHTRPSRFTIHVQPVGVYLTVAAMAFGQRPDLLIKHTIVQTKECRSASVHLQQLGTRLRVIATTTMAVSTMSATSASTGLLLLTVTTRTTCASTTMAASVRGASTIEHSVRQSVASKNNF